MLPSLRFFAAFITLAIGAATARAAADTPSSSATAPSAPAGVHVTNAWIRGLPAAVPSAGYLTIVNDSDSDVTLIRVTSPDYAMVHLHESYTTPGGDSGMRMVSKLRVPAHGKVSFAPGGYHLMLMRPTKELKAGDTASVVLHFVGGAALSVPMPVKPAAYNG